MIHSQVNIGREFLTTKNVFSEVLLDKTFFEVVKSASIWKVFIYCELTNGI